MAVLLLAVPFIWLIHAVAVAHLMDRQGFHPLSWFVLAVVMGPAVWPLAVAEAMVKPPVPTVVETGRRFRGPLNVAAFLADDDVPAAIRQRIEEVRPEVGRLALVRVVKEGGPEWVEDVAREFLMNTARRLRLKDAELWICYGTMPRAVQQVTRSNDFDLVLRSDRALVDDPYVQGARCLRDARAA
jgi:hypothetical protein